MALPKRMALIGLAGALLLGAAQAQAQNCQFYEACCEELVEAYREAGVRGARLEDFASTCGLYHALDAMPGAQELFCIDAWEAISARALEHFRQGRIGFFPPDCLEEEVLGPDEPDPGGPDLFDDSGSGGGADAGGDAD